MVDISAASSWQVLRARLSSDRGSAVVDFALVAPLLLLVVGAVMQLVLIWHVRVVMTSAAQEGARGAAKLGANVAEVEQLVAGRLEGSLASGLVRNVEVGLTNHLGVEAASVKVWGRLPMLGLLGPNALEVSAVSVIENW